MAQPDNWMQGDNPASDTCEPLLREGQHFRASRGRTQGARRRAGGHARASHLHEAVLGADVLGDVVPHLLRSFGRSEVPASDGPRRFGAQIVREFARAVVDADEEIALRLLDDLRSQGARADEIYLGLFADAARLLGHDWETDASPFTEVTLGLWRLHRLVRDLSPQFRREGARAAVALEAMLTTAPGEQHSFGLLLVCEWFSRAGWSIVPGPFKTDREIGRAVASRDLTIVGFSASAETNLDGLAISIAAVRRRSMNPHVGVMVGGALFDARPDLVARVGADATARDAIDALAKAQRFAISGQWASA